MGVALVEGEFGHQTTMAETTTCGILVRRIDPDEGMSSPGLLLITGSFVKGDHNNFHVLARALIVQDGQLTIDPSRRVLQFDPSCPVVKVGQIDYLDPATKQFFAAL